MKNKKQITVIIPVYNSEKWLDRIIDSIKSQSVFDQLDIIFVNDGSTDNSSKILNEINQPNVRIITQNNKGVSTARNTGIKNAKCDYIAFLDADDHIDNDFFKGYLDELENGYDLVISDYVVEYEDGKTCQKNNPRIKIVGNIDIFKYYLLGKIDPNCWGKLFKKEILSKCLFDEKMTHGEDGDMLFRYLKHCHTIYFDNCAKYHYCINNTSAMRKEFKVESLSTIKKAEERTEFIQTNYPNLSEYACSNEIDTKCRVLCNLYEFKQTKKYNALCKELKSDIRAYSIRKKKKFSTRKHFLAFVLVRLNPRLYVFAKNALRLQYK